MSTMPRFTVPRYLRVVTELPKTPSQRVQKFKLREEGVTADTYDREVKITIDRLMALLVPALTLGLAVVIGVIVMSVLMAILSINELIA